MNTLEQLKISNFQSLKDVELNLSPNFTAIVGESSLGKSAALRALRALVRNAAAPGLVRLGKASFRLLAGFSDGRKITLDKGKNLSTFTIQTPDQADIIYPKQGVKAPEDITLAWNMPAPDGREICFASQHDKPFLLDEPASVVAKVLGELTNASRLMEAVSEINRRRTGYVNDVKAYTRETTELSEALKQYEDLEEKQEQLNWVKYHYGQAQFARDLRNQLEHLVTQHAKLEKAEVVLAAQIAELEALAGEAHQMMMLADLFTHKAEVSRTAEKLSQECNELEQQIEQNENELHALMDEAGVCPLCGQGL